MDETYIRVNGAWKYLYRAVDKQGQTVDFLLTAKRDAAAARRFFEKAKRHSPVPDKVTMDKSGANQAGLEQLNKERQVPIEIRQVKYFNNIVEQDHRAIKRITRLMLGFKSFRAARAILVGIELMHMICKGRFMLAGEGMSFADQFYALAGQLRSV
jgi:putative transposase